MEKKFKCLKCNKPRAFDTVEKCGSCRSQERLHQSYKSEYPKGLITRLMNSQSNPKVGKLPQASFIKINGINKSVH